MIVFLLLVSHQFQWYRGSGTCQIKLETTGLWVNIIHTSLYLYLYTHTHLTFIKHMCTMLYKMGSPSKKSQAHVPLNPVAFSFSPRADNPIWTSLKYHVLALSLTPSYAPSTQITATFQFHALIQRARNLKSSKLTMKLWKNYTFSSIY